MCGTNLPWPFIKRGQKGTEGHLGIISVPFDLLALRCMIVLAMSDIGGTSQLFSPDHNCVKASTLSDPGFQYLELNLGILLF